MQQPPQLINITTEQIQKYLDENKELIIAIMENQNLGKLAETVSYQARLQQNLMYLAKIADAQPPAPTSSQTPTQSVIPQEQHVQSAQAAMAKQHPGFLAPKLPFHLNDQQQQQPEQAMYLQQQQQPEQAMYLQQQQQPEQAMYLQQQQQPEQAMYLQQQQQPEQAMYLQQQQQPEQAMYLQQQQLNQQQVGLRSAAPGGTYHGVQTGIGNNFMNIQGNKQDSSEDGVGEGFRSSVYGQH